MIAIFSNAKFVEEENYLSATWAIVPFNPTCKIRTIKKVDTIKM